MSKFIIEVPVDAQYIMINGVRMGDCYTQTTHIEDIEELNSDYINEHFGDLQDTAYQRGFEDGKAVNDKCCEGCKYQANGELTCPCSECANNFKNQWTAKDDKIEVGDEVTDIQSGAKFLVTHLWKNNHGDKGVSGFNNDCSAFSATLDKVSKTGRHFDIHKILKEMKE